MKRSIITSTLIGALLFIPCQARTEPPKQPWVALARCVSVVIVTVVGGVVITCVKNYCDRVFSNSNWRLTNELTSLAVPPLRSASLGDGTTTVQASSGLGSAWVNGIAFDIQQNVSNIVTCVASRDGVPLMTNSVGPVKEGQTVVFDFRSIPMTTNTPPSRIFRLVN